LLPAQLTLKVLDLRLGIPHGEVLHQHRLCEDVNGVGAFSHKLLQKLGGFGVLLLWRRASYALRERRKKLAFFRSHIYLHPLIFMSRRWTSHGRCTIEWANRAPELA
jgi:hypothetical protein